MPNSKAVFPKSGLALIALLVAASAALGVVHFVRSSAKSSVNSTATPGSDSDAGATPLKYGGRANYSYA
jgi:hypothetical protein